MPLESRKNRWDSTVKNVSASKIKSAEERSRLFDEIQNIPLPDTPNITEQRATKNENKNDIIENLMADEIKSNISFKPFAADTDKEARYEKFLLFQKLGLKGEFCFLQLFYRIS